MVIEKLKVNHIEKNINVEDRDLFISWVASEFENDSKMECFSICIKNDDGDTIWESGLVKEQRRTAYRCSNVPLKSDERYVFTISLLAKANGEMTEAKANGFFETGWLFDKEKKGIFIGETKEGENHLFRRDFRCNKEIKSAKLYVCGMGHFSCLINGKKVTENVLEPGWSDYRNRSFYVAYDIKDRLKSGNNCMLFRLGEGMFHVPQSDYRYVYYPRSFGLPKLWVRLSITYEDGEKEFIETDEEWKQIIGPDIYQEMYGGAYYDGRLYKKEYAEPDVVPDSSWEKASIVKGLQGKMTVMPIRPLKVMKVLYPVKVQSIADGIWLYDFGTNFSGWARIKIRLKKKTDRPIIMRPGELLKKTEDGIRVDQKVTGQNYSWIYVPGEGEEQEYAPDFTYTGFRYLEIEGATPLEHESINRESFPIIERVIGEFIYPDYEDMGKFTCSNKLFNDIHKIVRQAILSNTKSYFTDCPHRERLGWLEQTHLIGPSILYNFDAIDLYYKIEKDMVDSQHENGLVPDICPEYVTGFEKWHEGFVDSPEWGSAIVLNPWYIYRRCGDKTLIEQHYDSMKKYVDYLTDKTHHYVLHHGLGDWLDIGPNTPHSQNTPVAVVATCIYYLDLQIMVRAAKLLGNEKDMDFYSQLAGRVQEDYRLQFFDDQTSRFATGSQTAQAMSLMCGLVDFKDEKKVLKVLIDDIEKRGYAITAGDIGHPFLIAALMKYGMSDVINKMTNITEHPGYGYQVVNGATTLTEEWDGVDPDNPHGSQNHLMLGSIEEWFYGGLAGMEWIKGKGHWDNIFIKPAVLEDIDYVDASTWHPNGIISVAWRRNDKTIKVKVTIPFGIKATLCDREGNAIRQVGCGIHEYDL